MNRPLSKEIYAAMVRLKQEGIWFERKTAYHLKVGSYNFWPNSRKIHRDGASQCEPENGLDKFIKLVKDAEAEPLRRLRGPKGSARAVVTFYDARPRLVSLPAPHDLSERTTASNDSQSKRR